MRGLLPPRPHSLPTKDITLSASALWGNGHFPSDLSPSRVSGSAFWPHALSLYHQSDHSLLRLVDALWIVPDSVVGLPVRINWCSASSNFFFKSQSKLLKRSFKYLRFFWSIFFFHQEGGRWQSLDLKPRFHYLFISLFFAMSSEWYYWVPCHVTSIRYVGILIAECWHPQGPPHLSQPLGCLSYFWCPKPCSFADLML